SAADVTHYWLRRQWLYPDAGHSLDEDPWRHDWLLRLGQNDPRLLVFPSELHEPIAAVGPGHYIEFPMSHADCPLTSTPHGEKKAQKSERLRPGMRRLGLPFNHAYYLPEWREPVRTPPLPEQDRRNVEAVLAASESSQGTALLWCPSASREEIDRHW